MWFTQARYAGWLTKTVSKSHEEITYKRSS